VINTFMTTANLYRWTNIITGNWYIGSRTKKGCHPNDGYICSSRIVKPMILENPTIWVRELLCIGLPEYILDLESKMLTFLDAKNDKCSYNLHNGDGKFTTCGISLSDTHKKKISMGNLGKVRSNESIENYRRANQAKAIDPTFLKKLSKPKSDEHGRNVSKALKGIPKTTEHKKSLSDAKKGKLTGPCTDKRKKAISLSLKGKSTLPLTTCPHCGLEGRSNMKRWHFDNCRKK